MGEEIQARSIEKSDDEVSETEISNISLQIQFSATAVATSLILIFVPNVETISFTAFLIGYLFPIGFALTTILTMVVTWEIVISMVFTFSGLTFPFKIFSWVIIGLMGVGARKINVKYFYEFAILGGIAAFLFDMIVTVSTAIIFQSSEGAFYTVLFSTFILGFIFTLSHTASNALLFAFIPAILRVILPLLRSNYSHLVMIKSDTFDYLKDAKIRNSPKTILLLDRRRLSIYSILAVVMITSLVFAGISAYLMTQPQVPDENGDGITDTPGAEPFNMTIIVDYSGVLETDNYMIEAFYNESALYLVQQVAIVNYTDQFSQPFIQAINNVWQDQNLTNHYWVYYVNGEYVSTGAAQTYFEAGDEIVFSYED